MICYCILCKQPLEKSKKFTLTSYRIESKDGENHARICNDCYKSAHNPSRKGAKVYA